LTGADCPPVFDRIRAGWHAVKIRLVPEASWDLVVLLAGDQVAAPLAGASLRHSTQ